MLSNNKTNKLLPHSFKTWHVQALCTESVTSFCPDIFSGKNINSRTIRTKVKVYCSSLNKQLGYLLPAVMLSVVTYNSVPWQAFTVINMEANYCPLKDKFGINIPIQALELRYLNKYQYTPAHIYIPTVLTSSEAENTSCFTYPCSDTVTQICCL